MNDPTHFRYYTDGEYEYRVGRGLDDSGVRGTGRANMRKWSLAQRDLAASEIVVKFLDGEVSDNAAKRWESCHHVFLKNEATHDDAARRLLGSQLYTEVTTRTETVSPEPKPAVVVTLDIDRGAEHRALAEHVHELARLTRG